MALGQDKQRAYTMEYEITITNFLKKKKCSGSLLSRNCEMQRLWRCRKNGKINNPFILSQDKR